MHNEVWGCTEILTVSEVKFYFILDLYQVFERQVKQQRRRTCTLHVCIGWERIYLMIWVFVFRQMKMFSGEDDTCVINDLYQIQPWWFELLSKSNFPRSRHYGNYCFQKCPH